MNDAMVMVDSRGDIMLWSRTAQAFFGYAAVDVIGQNVELLVPPEYRPQHQVGHGRAMSGGERHLDGASTHLPVRHADGTVVRHPARFNHVFTANGELPAAIAVFGPAAPDAAPWTPVTQL